MSEVDILKVLKLILITQKRFFDLQAGTKLPTFW